MWTWYNIMSGNSAEEILQVANLLADENNLRAAVRPSVNGALISGAGALIGGLLLGPRGILLGGSLGASAAACFGPQFRPVSFIIMNIMTAGQREQLVALLRDALRRIGIVDVMLAIAVGNVSARQILLQTLMSFLRNHMSNQLH